MTSLTATRQTAPDVSNLTATAGLRSIVLDWDLDGVAVRGVQIWRATTNNRASATKIKTVWGESYTDVDVTSGTTYYYWVRVLSIWLTEDGDWEPVSATGGVSVEMGYTTAKDLESEECVINGGSWRYSYDFDNTHGTSYGGGGASRSAMSTTGFDSSGISTGSGGDIAGSNPISSWSTWTDCAWTGYVGISGTTLRGLIVDATGSVDWGTPSGTTGYVELWARVVLYNKTDSTISEAGNPISICKLEYDYSKTYWAQQNFTIKYKTLSGSDLIASGKDHDVRLQLYKYRSDSGSSWTVDWTSAFIDTQIDPR